MNGDSSSGDLDALNKVVKINANLEQVRWEIFSTPEYKESVPGPTDYVSLVVVVKSSAINKKSPAMGSGFIWIAPDSARPWMTKESHLFFKRFKNTTVDISLLENCGRISAQLVKTKRNIDGLACNYPSGGLLYFVLEDYTA